MEPPYPVLIPEMADWNNGTGIDIEGWVACSGSFQLAIGYASVFWPRFVSHGEYIFREGFSAESVLGFEKQCGGDRRAVEAVVNHLHIADIQFHGCEDISRGRIVFLGNILREIYEAKLHWQFPERPCEVVFMEPEDPDNLIGYEITFWQKQWLLARP